MKRILVRFEDIPMGCFCYESENSIEALFERSEGRPEDTLWSGSKFWIIDWSTAPEWANSVAVCDYDDPITNHVKGKFYWMAASDKPPGGGTIGYFVGYQLRPKKYKKYLSVVDLPIVTNETELKKEIAECEILDYC